MSTTVSRQESTTVPSGNNNSLSGNGLPEALARLEARIETSESQRQHILSKFIDAEVFEREEDARQLKLDLKDVEQLLERLLAIRKTYGETVLPKGTKGNEKGSSNNNILSRGHAKKPSSTPPHGPRSVHKPQGRFVAPFTTPARVGQRVPKRQNAIDWAVAGVEDTIDEDEDDSPSVLASDEDS